MRMEDAFGDYGIDRLLPQSAPSNASFLTRSAAEPHHPLLDDSRYARKLGMVRLPDGKTY